MPVEQWASITPSSIPFSLTPPPLNKMAPVVEVEDKIYVAQAFKYNVFGKITIQAIQQGYVIDLSLIYLNKR